DTGLLPDLTIAVRLNPSNTEAMDYYVLPSIDFTIPKLQLKQDNALSLDAYRFETLDFLYSLAGRCSLEKPHDHRNTSTCCTTRAKDDSDRSGSNPQSAGAQSKEFSR